MSLKIWMIFHLVYGEEPLEKVPSLHLHDSSKVIPSHMQGTSNALITPPSRALMPHLSVITAPSMEWLTILSIFDTPLERRDWVRLAEMTNLSLLHVENWRVKTGALDDVVLREWARAAREDGAFSELRMILLRNQPLITVEVFDDLEYMPALRIIHVASPIMTGLQVWARVEGKGWLHK
jgi:hypothetical protein